MEYWTLQWTGRGGDSQWWKGLFKKIPLANLVRGSFQIELMMHRHCQLSRTGAVVEVQV